MGSMSVFHWLLVLAIILIVFGAGRLPNVMGDFAKGIKAFKAGMRDEDKPDETATASAPGVEAQRTAATPGVSASISDRKAS
ncbi:MAG TPA: twin-arginine translocase TatA/TatE family subunit [Stellaceae bacterium]|nr:twin-arginine translocase TatA/TatE family subunit [Stellaceae bacterium]